jgi:D-glycero-alpha-D-manno-heptose-7-phosphate kinase
VRSITARAPCRVDLAGGTLDIWPLGLLHGGAATVNVAIDVEVRVELKERSSGWRVSVADESFDGDSPAELRAHDSSRLAALVLEHYGMPPVEVIIHSASPRNAGLGASSALCVALLRACEELLGRPASAAAETVHVARDIEAGMMSLPTGVQDHYPALMGGVLEIRYAAGGETVRRLAVDLEALAERLVVVYSGRSHFSAGNNYEVISRRLRGDAEVSACLQRIADVTLPLAEALMEGAWPEVGALMSREMSARRGLSPVVSTPEVESVLGIGVSCGAWGGKVCGAGGGGCVALLVEPTKRVGLERSLRDGGFSVLHCRPCAAGLSVEG